MNRKTLIWLGVGVAVAVAIYFIAKNKTGGLFAATGDLLAPEKNAFKGVVNRDTQLYKSADGGLYPMPVVMRKGERVSWFGQADGMLKVDCDGIWIDQNCVTADPEFRNFMGDKLEPTQDLLTGKIF
jgi:hypothetical protein